MLRTLIFVSMVQPGQKCFMEQRRFIKPLDWWDPSTWLDWLRRKQSAETIGANLQTIERALDEGIAALQKFPVHRDLILSHLWSVAHGLDALETTYADHPGVIASLRILKAQIELLEKPTQEVTATF